MRPIDADALIAEFDGYIRLNRKLECATNLFYADAAAALKKTIQDSPTIDAKPVVHGEWIVLGQRTYGSGRSYTHYCTKCGQHGYDDYKLCPNCGADMRERKET